MRTGQGRDRRPYLTVRSAAEAAGGRSEGDGNATFSRVAPLHTAEDGDLAFLAHRRYVSQLTGCRGSALLVSESLSGWRGGPESRIIVDDPYTALLTLLPLLEPASIDPVPAVHRKAVVDPLATLGPDVAVGPHTAIESGAELGEGVRVGANCVIGEGAVVGPRSVLHHNVTLYAGVVLGAHVVVHSGARVGVDGFGYVARAGGHAKFPQVGECVVEDDVEIGANCTIDRGSIGRTVIGAGAKLDNLVHIAHNVSVGPGSILAAQVGVAGSVRVGNGVLMGGQAGISGHIAIGDGARIGAQAGVIGDVAPGQTVSGYPARDHRSFLRAMAHLLRLSNFIRRLERLERLDDRRGAR